MSPASRSCDARFRISDRFRKYAGVYCPCRRGICLPIARLLPEECLTVQQLLSHDIETSYSETSCVPIPKLRVCLELTHCKCIVWA